VKRVLALILLMILAFNTIAYAGREYILKYAYPENVKTISIYDLLGDGAKVSKNKKVSYVKKDKVAPYVVSSNPKNGLQNVKVGSSITLNFNEGVKVNNLKSISLIGNGKRVGFSIKLNGNKITIRPNTLLSYGTNYVLSLPSGSFKDFVGNLSKAFVLKFKTEEIKFAENDKNNDNTSYFSYIFDDGKNIVKNYSYKTNGEYLFFADIKNISRVSGIKFDENNIPMVNYNGYKYNPLLIAEWGLQNYSYYKRSQNGEYLKRAKNAADFLAYNINDNGLWINDFDYKESNISMKRGWASSLTQGLGISLLIRMYNETLDQKYLNAAKLALAPLRGELKESLNGFPMFDMFNVRTKYTFSSFMFVLFGLYDISGYDDSAKEMFYEGVETLRYLMPKFYGTTDKFYKSIHDAQIRALCSILDVDSIDEYLDDFEVIDIEWK